MLLVLSTVKHDTLEMGGHLSTGNERAEEY